jgi:FixJ family two-component response regulator
MYNFNNLAQCFMSGRTSRGDLREGAAGLQKIVSIVDDDESVREATKGLVRSLGYSAVAFSSAEEFLNSDSLNDTSCLITDVQMPGISGVELQHTLIEQGHNLPIIFVTAYPEDRIRTRVLAAGAIDFLSKPFSDDELIGSIGAALGDSAPDIAGV